MKVLPLLLVLLIVGCNGASDQAREDSGDIVENVENGNETISDGIHNTLKKAEDVEGTLMDAKDDLDDALDEALGE